MKVLSHGVLPLLLLLTLFNNANAQCNSWVGNPRETEAKEAHVLYRQMVKLWCPVQDFLTPTRPTVTSVLHDSQAQALLIIPFLVTDFGMLHMEQVAMPLLMT